MVLVSAAAVSSFFLATAAFFRGFTEPTTTNRPTLRPIVPLNLRFGIPAVDHLEEEATNNHNAIPSSSSISTSSVSIAHGTHHVHHTVAHHDGNLFTSRLDNIDMDRILNNRRLVHNYVGCVVGKKPCTAEGKEFKRSLPDVLLTECAKCSVQMQRNIEHMVHVLQKEYPLEWQQLVKHYDPDGSYRKRYPHYLLASDDLDAGGSTTAASTSTPA
ncbi:uncharacterized protein LOC135942972 [Cloeon dipterum]|uniref:uncharacterized protein LOC135942972 n=1 Tax=Cloeon dipterum TaxID=197152 RepID=UPI0032205764